MDLVFDWSGQFALGTLMTVQLALGALALGLLLGLAGATAKLSKDPVARALANIYTSIVRGIPELLIVLIIYFGSSGALTALAEFLGYENTYVELSPYVAGVLALGFMFGAYATEVFRGAIIAIPKGQTEAAQAFGMGSWLTFRRITLPQVWRIALPGLGNLFLVLMKDTALVSVIGLNEILRVSSIAAQATKDTTTFYSVALVIFLLLTIVTMRGQARAERWARRGMPSNTG
ncbi:MAG: ABC transporter permease subunit [Rhodospirillales bacterium]|nr:ABC transporter permease subunit [Rhodospirillales bacterium]